MKVSLLPLTIKKLLLLFMTFFAWNIRLFIYENCQKFPIVMNINEKEEQNDDNIFLYILRWRQTFFLRKLLWKLKLYTILININLIYK